MSEDQRNSLRAVTAVSMFVLVGAAALQLLKVIELPSWTLVVVGALGIAELAMFATKLRRRRHIESAGLADG